MKSKANIKTSEIKKINKDLKNQLRALIDQITKIIQEMKKKEIKMRRIGTVPERPQRSLDKTTDESSILDVLNDLPFDQQVQLYTRSISSLRNKIDKFENLRYIEKYEKELQTKEEALASLKKENETLVSLNTAQVKHYSSFTLEAEMKENVKSFSEALLIEKTKIKKMKSDLKTIESTIQNQNNKIFSLNNQCSFIKANINLKKNKKFSAVSPQMKQNELVLLEGKSKELLKNLEFEQNGYENEIASQERRISKITSDIEEIQAKIKTAIRLKSIAYMRQQERCHFAKISPIRFEKEKSRPVSKYRTRNVTPTIGNRYTQVLLKKNRSFIDKKRNELNNEFSTTTPLTRNVTVKYSPSNTEGSVIVNKKLEPLKNKKASNGAIKTKVKQRKFKFELTKEMIQKYSKI